MKVEKKAQQKLPDGRRDLIDALDNLPADTDHCIRLTTAREGRGIINLLGRYKRKGFRLNLRLDGEDIMVWKKTK